MRLRHIGHSARALSASAFVATGLVSAGFAATAAPASAAIGCDSLITASTTLTSNIGPCPGDGLKIMGSGVTLRLNRHRIFAANGPGDNAGIRVINSTGVTVADGTVEGFDAGVAIFGGSGNVVKNVTALNNINDLNVDNNPEDTCDLGDGIAIFDSSNNTVTGNRLLHNGPFSGASVVGDSNNNTIGNNVAQGNNVPGPGCGNPSQDEGIRIEGPGADNNIVKRNTVVDSLLDNIGLHGYVCGADDPVDNTPPNQGTIVRNNSTSGAAGAQSAGIAFLQQGPSGVVCPAFNSIVEDNSSTSNEGDGIFVSGASANNKFNRNTVANNAGAGIFLNGPAFGNDFTNVGPTLLDLVSPNAPPYVENTDYGVLAGSGSGNVTAQLVPVGNIMIPAPGFDTSTSGCSPDDFVGFPPGAVALIQRGFCGRAEKVANALAAQASAVVLFNEGTPGREGIPPGVDPTTIPVVGTTYQVGVDLYNLTQAGTVTIHVKTNTINVQTLIAPGAHDNTLTNNRGFNNALFDADDENFAPPCDNNTWAHNSFGTVNQACVSSSATVPAPLRKRVTNTTGSPIIGATRSSTRMDS